MCGIHNHIAGNIHCIQHKLICFGITLTDTLSVNQCTIRCMGGISVRYFLVFHVSAKVVMGCFNLVKFAATESGNYLLNLIVNLGHHDVVLIRIIIDCVHGLICHTIHHILHLTHTEYSYTLAHICLIIHSEKLIQMGIGWILAYNIIKYTSWCKYISYALGLGYFI